MRLSGAVLQVDKDATVAADANDKHGDIVITNANGISTFIGMSREQFGVLLDSMVEALRDRKSA